MSAKQPDANRWIALRQNGTALLDQVLVSSANFLTTWIIGRFGSDGELGLFLLGSTAVITVLSVLESLVCMPYIFLAHRQSPEKLPAYTGSSLLHVMALSVLAVFVLLLVALAGGERLATGLPNILYVISFILPFHLLRMFLRRFHLSTFDMSGLLKYDALAFVAQLSILLLAWQQDWVRGTTGFLAIGAAGILVSLLWLKQSGAAYSLTNQVTSHFSENWKFGKSVLSAQLMWVLHLHAMIWMLTYSYDKQLAGQYGACMAVVMLVNPFVSGHVERHLAARRHLLCHRRQSPGSSRCLEKPWFHGRGGHRSPQCAALVWRFGGPVSVRRPIRGAPIRDHLPRHGNDRRNGMQGPRARTASHPQAPLRRLDQLGPARRNAPTSKPTRFHARIAGRSHGARLCRHPCGHSILRCVSLPNCPITVDSHRPQ